MEIDTGAVPLLDGALELVEGNVPGGGRTNQQYFGARVSALGVSPDLLLLLHDPQTSGGLLAAVAPDQADAAAQAFVRAGAPAWLIGRVVEAGGAATIVLR
jgi:selenide,water dikinase